MRAPITSDEMDQSPKAKTMEEEEDDPAYQRALYESMNAISGQTIDGDGVGDANKAKAEMSFEQLMQAMNDAMKNGDKSRAQKLLKRWEAGLS